MHKLVIVLIAVILTGILLGSGLSYVPSDLGATRQIRAVTEGGVAVLRGAWLAYRADHSANPASLAALAPYTASPAVPVTGWTWSVDGSEGWICLRGTGNETQWTALSRYAATPGSGAAVGGDCGLSASEALGGGFPTMIALTVSLGQG